MVRRDGEEVESAVSSERACGRENRSELSCMRKGNSEILADKSSVCCGEFC